MDRLRRSFACDVGSREDARMSHDAALQNVIDQAAIQQLIALYIEAASSGDIDIVAST